MLAHRSRALSVQMIAHVFAAALIAHEHLVSAPAAPDDAVQQHVAVARGSPGLVAHVFGSIVAEDATDLLVCGPIDIGRTTILHDEAPLLHRPRSLHRSTGSACNRASLPTPIEGRTTILHDEAPLLHRPRSLHRSTGSACNRASLPTPIEGRITILHDEAPLLHRPRSLH